MLLINRFLANYRNIEIQTRTYNNVYVTKIDQQLKNTSTTSNASNYCKLNDHLSAKVWSVVYLAYGFKYSLPYL